MGLLISVNELASDHHCLVFDCRSHLGNPDQGKKDFEAGHIPGAQHADLDKHLSTLPDNGTSNMHGRHPLPDRDKLVEQFREWGINTGSRIICYDQNNGAFAARLWWLCRWLGHDQVFVLDGGLDAWVKDDRALSTVARTYPHGDFVAGAPLTKICLAEDILTPSNLLLDARDGARFRGEVEPIDPVAGHIPGALSAPFTENMDDGYFKAAPRLKERFDKLLTDEDKQVVCYCGSGVTAIHNILALMLAGFPEPALYPGSWSEWITDPERPIETGPNE